MTSPASLPITHLRKFLLVAALTLSLTGVAFGFSYALNQYKARLSAIDAQLHKSAQQDRTLAEAHEITSNARYLQFLYPGARRLSVYTNQQIDVPTNLPAPVSYTFTLDYPGKGLCYLNVDAAGLFDPEAAIFRPISVNCNGIQIKATGVVFDNKKRWPRGVLITAPTAQGQYLPFIRMAKGTQMDAWLLLP